MCQIEIDVLIRLCYVLYQHKKKSIRKGWGVDAEYYRLVAQSKFIM